MHLIIKVRVVNAYVRKISSKTTQEMENEIIAKPSNLFNDGLMSLESVSLPELHAHVLQLALAGCLDYM